MKSEPYCPSSNNGHKISASCRTHACMRMNPHESPSPREPCTLESDSPPRKGPPSLHNPTAIKVLSRSPDSPHRKRLHAHASGPVATTTLLHGYQTLHCLEDERGRD